MEQATESVHQLKWICWQGGFVAIVTQNENGPCPLLALCNVLLLNKLMSITPGETVITSKQLMDLLGSCLVNCRPKNLTDTEKCNYEQNMQDAIGIFPRLLTGLDVNVKFSSVSGFEFTQELSIFDLLGVKLYHGWLVDPGDHPTYSVVSQYTYNQLVEMAINDITSEDSTKLNSALLAEQFLQYTASQLTYHGLYELNRVIKEGELCVFFRNNHFNTLLKQKNQLLLLVTDYGFLNELGHVWHILNDIDDSGDFLDANFQYCSVPVTHETTVNNEFPAYQDIDAEIAIGLQAQESDSIPNEQITIQTDEELALRLQNEELSQLQEVSEIEPDVVLPPPPQTKDEYELIAAQEERRRRNNREHTCLIL